MDGQIYDLEQRVCHLQTMLHSMCNRDEQPSANTSFRCTSPGFINGDYAQHYASSPLSFDREYDEIEKSHQNKDQMEEVKCVDGNQKRNQKKKMSSKES
jgi:hypothetical protein